MNLKQNDIELTLKNGDTLRKKRLLKLLHIDFYEILLKQASKNINGLIIELGSGAGFLKEIEPKVLTSDILDIFGVDKVFSAEKIPFKNSSVRSFVGLNILHHIKDPTKAFSEMERCLKAGGTICFIEPSNTIWSRFIYRNFHHEIFDEKAEWRNMKKRALFDSNIALPWIIFSRDIDKFNILFPKLKVKSIHIHTPFTYLISGGLTKFQLLPTCMYRFVRKIDNILTRQGMFMTIIITKSK